MSLLTGRTKISAIKKSPDEGLSLVGQEVTLKGWIRSVRDQKHFIFIDLNDGSTLSGLQILVDPSLPALDREFLTTGAAISVTGTVVESPGKGQAVEIQASSLKVVGTCDASTYPLQKKKHSFEFLRTLGHLRPRTNALGALTRIRNQLAWATHKFFQERGFLYLNTPIITGSDCEGAGEMFRVTTLDMKQPPKTEDGDIDFSQDFFGKPTYLTVSGQLNAEIYACALSDVYTFGPTFRSENSNTSRHLAEFWMIEPEMAFADLQDDIECATSYLKYLLSHVMEHCAEDLQLFDRFVSKGLLERLHGVVDQDFAQISYTEAIDILEKSKRFFEFPVKWGADLQSEHERYLAEEHFKRPLVVTDYPKGIKAFYMRSNDDEKTVAAMDVLVPKVGEIIGGSQREERYDVLHRRIQEMGLPEEDYWWYLDLRKYGSAPHAGFGLGFERLVLFVTGMENIREAIPFPRVPGHAEF